MKTRIIYPKRIWYNKRFKKLSFEARILCLYLITNENIGLIPIYSQPDLEICFKLGFSEKKLEELKQELQNSELFFFHDEWVLINNDFSYCDYFGRDRLMESKAKEEKAIPQHILTALKPLINPLQTSYKPPINTKHKIINNKPKNKNPKSEDVSDYEERFKQATGLNIS